MKQNPLNIKNRYLFFYLNIIESNILKITSKDFVQIMYNEKKFEYL